MRKIVALLAVLVAGCAAAVDISDVRPPKSQAETDYLNELLVKVNRVGRALQVANPRLLAGLSLCQSQVSRCILKVEIGIGHDTQALATDDIILLTDKIIELAETDDGLAMVIGHEWAHQLLQHTDEATRSLKTNRQRETEADCVGALLLTGAGYDAAKAAEVWKRLGAETFGLHDVATLSNSPTSHGTFTDRYTKTIQSVEKAKRMAGAGKPITAGILLPVCGATI